MGYRVKIESFEGPFELLLALVTQQKVKIDSISISEVADQYIEHINEMQDLDMDVASEFLIVASTLLAMKAKALLPVEAKETDDPDELTLEQTTDLLAARIITYYQYKRLATMLGSRMQNESYMHPRTAGPEPQFLGLLPDYLEGVTLEGLGVVCASLMARRETFLLDAEHIAAKPIAIGTYVDSIALKLEKRRNATFEQIIEDAEDKAEVVVSFLAILEMYKRGMIDLVQEAPGKAINIAYIDPERWSEFALVDDAPDEPASPDAEGEQAQGEGDE